MKKMKYILKFILICTVMFASCQKILFRGEESSREILLKDFHNIDISGIYDIVFVQDSSNKLIIRGKNDINSIGTLVSNDTLLIDDHKKMSLNPARNMLEIHFRDVNYIITRDPVNISNRDTIHAELFQYCAVGEISETSLVLDCNYLVLATTSNSLGYFHLSGSSDYCDLSARYGCSIFAEHLLCENADILNESVGDIHTNASVKLRVWLKGPGNIFCHSEPETEIVEQSGKGRMIYVQGFNQ